MMWFDGHCKLCGSEIEEGPDDILGEFDYKNRCTNQDCVHHEWHFCFDCEFLDYYKHKGIQHG